MACGDSRAMRGPLLTLTWPELHTAQAQSQDGAIERVQCNSAYCSLVFQQPRFESRPLP
jgi:hypothetical protein